MSINQNNYRHSNTKQQKHYDHEPQVGDKVYFHAFFKYNKEEVNCLCQGLVYRKPTYYSKVYRVIITKINTYNLDIPFIVFKNVLQTKIPRHSSQLFKTFTDWMNKKYQQLNWVSINPTQESQIYYRITKYCKK